MKPQAVDGQWLDFYALLEVPVNADEDTVRKRIGKVYSEAAANCEHRDLSKRHYYQALVERVLPQCRRVLLDPEWRAKYDRQHILHSIEDPSAQDYVAFIASVRGTPPTLTDASLPTRVQEEIRIAQAVVQTVQTGESLELLPSRSLSSKALPEEEVPLSPQLDNGPLPGKKETTGATAPQASAPAATPATAPPAPAHPAPVQPEPRPFVEVRGKPASMGDTGPRIDAAALAAELDAAQEQLSSERVVQAKVISAEEAQDIRRRRSSNPDAGYPLAPPSLQKTARKKAAPSTSRVMVGEAPKGSGKGERLISTTSLNLMVAITGVLLTITIQKLAVQPAVATSTTRAPLVVAYSSSLRNVLNEAAQSWERTREGSEIDVRPQPEDARAGLDRALGRDGANSLPDVWIPSDSVWSQGYNQIAASKGTRPITMDSALVQTPVVLVARSDKAALLRKRFPSRTITSWSALRQAVQAGASNHFGITDPRRSGAGSMARYSMAREWSVSNGKPLKAALGSAALWSWMDGFESNSLAASLTPSEMVKDLALGTTGRFWWAVGYESDALAWMSQGKPVEIFYLPRTHYANHPYCYMNRVGASSETLAAQASFENFLRSESTQKTLLKNGFRPTEISLETKVEGNPFLDSSMRKRGARAGNLPPSERIDFASVTAIGTQWAQRYS